MVRVVWRRWSVDGDREAEHLRIEGLRPLDVADGEADVMDRSDRQ
jgi:hypothetical protein